MSKFIKIAQTNEVSPGTGKVVDAEGKSIALFNVAGNFYAIDAATGKQLFAQKFDGAFGAGVITYAANGSQKVAVAIGLEAIFWPTEQSTAKVVVLGL